MNASITIDLPDEDATIRLGDGLALLLRAGDCLTLSGSLGAGKTTLARAILRGFCGDDALDVPSPSFSLVQPYEGDAFRFPIAHSDFYRLEHEEDAEELGLDEYLAQGALLIEWPERGPQRFSRSGFHIALSGTAARRAVLSSVGGACGVRLNRFAALRTFLEEAGFGMARRHFLQGDASPRAYEIIGQSGRSPLILMNADAKPDQPASPERAAYMSTTHLAASEDIRPVVAIAGALRGHGFSAPEIRAFSIEKRAVLFEDLGKEYIVKDGMAVPERYALAVQVLAAMHQIDWPDTATGPEGISHVLPFYSRRAMETEIALFLDKYLTGLKGKAADERRQHSFAAAWAPALDIIDKAPRTWTIYDFHSPNLHWLADRQGLQRIGIIDSQDARLGPFAYDVVSLIQDARIAVPETLQHDLLQRYLKARAAADPAFDQTAFLATYAICGAQRATRILGVFARLAAQDGKPHYLRHIPVVSAYLDACLKHPSLTAVRRWFLDHAPEVLEKVS